MEPQSEFKNIYYFKGGRKKNSSNTDVNDPVKRKEIVYGTGRWDCWSNILKQVGGVEAGPKWRCWPQRAAESVVVRDMGRDAGIEQMLGKSLWKFQLDSFHFSL